jgi:hypothetical protein
MTESLHSLGKSLFPAREVDWASVFQAELPRLYNFFRRRVGDGRLAESIP